MKGGGAVAALAGGGASTDAYVREKIRWQGCITDAADRCRAVAFLPTNNVEASHTLDSHRRKNPANNTADYIYG